MVYLVIKDNVCVNRIAYDGGDWSPPTGTTIEPEGEQVVDIGWERIDGVWTAPAVDPDAELEDQA
jgi:hypothetical protein